MWIYIQTEIEVFTVGFYDPKGIFQSESDHETADTAAQRVSWLNGGRSPSQPEDGIARGYDLRSLHK